MYDMYVMVPTENWYVCSFALRTRNPSDRAHYYTPRKTPNAIMAPSLITSVEPLIDFQEKAALLVVVADDVGTLEVEVEVDVNGDTEVAVAVVVGTGKKDKVGCPDAWLQNC